MISLLPLLESCTPRPKEQTSEDYAADLHKALGGEIRTAANAADFFAGTYATPSMRRVTTGIFDRLRHGSSANQPAFIRFDSAFGGGKTHTLIALAAAAKHPELIRAGAAGGLLSPELAVDDVRLVCFTGENANILQGMAMDGTNRRAKSLTGFLAYHLGGEAAYDELKEHDDHFSDPGAAGFQELIGDRPTLILIDEPARWVAAAKQINDIRRAGDGLRNALTAIAKVVANSERAALVITTAEPGSDAYRDESEAVRQQIQAVMQELDSVTARTAQAFTPTDAGDLPAILRRRLFTNAEDNLQRDAVAQAYAAIWRRRNPSDTDAEETFKKCYPFHPETIRIITERLANNNDFQRVRGTLRALSAAIYSGSAIAEPLLHPYHLDVAIPDVAYELVNRTGHQALDAAIQADVTGSNATAQRFGTTTRRAANIILLGSLAPTANNGLADAEIVNGLVSPAEPDDSVATQAVRNMKDNGLYIDDNPDAGTTRFNRQANVRREVEQRASAVSENDREDGIVECIREAFADRDGMSVTVFPTRANNVPDDPNRVHIGIINPSHITMQSSDRDTELGNLYRYSDGNGGNAPRNHRNNVLFLVPSNGDLAEIKRQMARHKAANETLQANDSQLLPYQKETLQGISQSSRKAVYQGIQRNWVNLYYPEPSAQPHRLQHARLHFPDQVGRGQATIVEFLTGNAVGKMASPRNPALAPNAWADIGLGHAKGDGLTVGELHSRFTGTAGRTMFLKRAHFDYALDQANETGAVVIRNPHGLEIASGSGISYQDDMTVWLAQYAPQSPVPGGNGGTSSGGNGTNGNGTGSGSGPAPVYLPPFRSQTATGQVVLADMNAYLASNGSDWADITDATVYGTSIALLNDLASQAQARGAAVAISYEFDANGFEVRATGKTAEQWQQCSRACAQMQRAAGLADGAPINASIDIAAVGNADDAVKRMLHELDNNTHQVQLVVNFRQPDA